MSRYATRACFHCHARKPAEAFPWSDGKRGQGKVRRRRRVCAECLTLEAVEKQRRRAARRRTYMQDGRLVRKCRTCDIEQDLELGYYRARAVPTGFPSRDFQWDCKSCQIKRVCEYQEKQRRNARYRAQRAAQTRRWRQQHRERARALRRAYRARVAADPVRRARARESQRLARRLRRERDGVLPADLRPGTLIGPRPPDVLPHLPAAPLSAAIERIVLRDGRPAVCARTGVTERTMFRWSSGEAITVRFNTADRVLTRLGLAWWLVYRDEPIARLAWEGESSELVA